MLPAYSSRQNSEIDKPKKIIILIGIMYKLDIHLKKEGFFIKSSLPAEK